ncbi:MULTISPECIES: hypothetical protein [unclassified Variovorax]|uniref:hypothetical protein n=1 Tax=unclassified Variovorax TaxID=663243 RepID=UPI00083945C2|nr:MULTISPECIES: hypothetical protein [unclassified Variovorax]PNG49853.1 hypothetical protein CHC06_05434 [Variovorax sp. B2]PNG50725.1 hypothetical protein CHC07_05339 [Variovorax sp. B4]VTV17929.1 hypothetical protein WDL1P1_00773 [Variovorax sp. WDL1]
MLKPLIALTAALYLGSGAASAPPPAAPADGAFQLLQVGDAPQGGCGTYVHSRGTLPGAASVMFMSTDRVLFLRTADGVRTLELASLDQKLRVKDVLGRGDTLNLKFRAPGKERAWLVATVSEAVVDDDGGYPLIAFDVKGGYISPTGARFDSPNLVAHDTCL